MRQVSMLDPAHSSQIAHGFCLTGGSGLGLGASTGVQDFLAKQGVGVEIGSMRVASVPAVAIYDLAKGEAAWPGEANGYEAARSAVTQPVEGGVGAGTGATIGKVLGVEHASSGAFATYGIQTGSFSLAAFGVVNAFGNVIDPGSGNIIAGVRDPVRGFLDAEHLLLTGKGPVFPGIAQPRATTLVLVVTDARLDFRGAAAVARVAQAGVFETIRPVATPVDGDVLFVWSVGLKKARFFDVALCAKTAVKNVILRSARLGANREQQGGTDVF